MKTLLSIAILTFFFSTAYAGEKLHLMKVHGAVCASCAYGLEKKLKKFEGVTGFNIDFKAGVVSVCTDENTNFEKKQLTKIFLESGYTFKGVEIKTACSLDSNTANKNIEKSPALNPGEDVTVSGLFNGMCEDGEDFYFVYKNDVLEVILPKKGMPENIVKGTTLKVSGTVVNYGDELKIKANNVDTQ